MTLTELQAEVYTLTNRSDLVSQTLAAVKAATLKLHQMDFYAKDLVETAVSFPTAAYEQQLQYIVNFPRWRALKYIRKVSSTDFTPYGKPLTVLTPAQILDKFLITKEDVVYEAGLVLNIKCAEQVQYFLLGYYQNPDVTTGTYTSWIAQLYPYAIVFDAAATVSKAIGKTEEEASYRLLAAEQKALIATNNIQTEGY